MVNICDVIRSGVVVPGNCLSVARQFLRCVLHQLAPNNVFPQIFMSRLGGSYFVILFLPLCTVRTTETILAILVSFAGLIESCQN